MRDETGHESCTAGATNMLRTRLRNNRTTGVYRIENGRVASEWSLVAPWPPNPVGTIALDESVFGVIGDDDWALEVVRTIRAAGSQAPILVLRHSSGSEGAVALLNSGADCCHAHDCEMTEIEAIIAALWRRGPIRHAKAKVEIDDDNRALYLDGERFEFGPVAFLVVRYLVTNSDRWVTQREIIERAIVTHYRPDSAVARVQIFQIRKVLGRRRNFIRHGGKRGNGYMFTTIDLVQERESGTFPVGAS
ncbi:MAG: winged helix-turn-helix domain-containing protein [Pseudomonadota bacterium]